MPVSINVTELVTPWHIPHIRYHEARYKTGFCLQKTTPAILQLWDM